MSSAINHDVERFDRWAATYDQSIMQRLFFDPVHARMLDLLTRSGPRQAPESILDVGCGTGRLLNAVSERWPEAKLFGADPAEQMVSKASRHLPNAVFKVASAESLPFPDDSIDMVLTSISFHHWADQGKGIQEISRVLRPGGWFCLADHHFLLSRWFGEKVRSAGEIRAFITAAGLAIRLQAGMVVRFVLITLAQKEI